MRWVEASGSGTVLSKLASLSPPHFILDAVFDVAVSCVASLSNVVAAGLALARGATDKRRLGAGCKDPRGVGDSTGVAAERGERAVAARHAARGARCRMVRNDAIVVFKNTSGCCPRVFNPSGVDGGVQSEV